MSFSFSVQQALVDILAHVPPNMVKPLAFRYVAGESMVDMLHCAEKLNQQGYLTTADVLGESITTKEQAEAAKNQYLGMLHALKKDKIKGGVSVKLTQMGLKLDKQRCLLNMVDIVALAATHGQFVRIDMEDSSCTDATLEIYQTLRNTHSNVGIVLQAYLKRTADDVERLIQKNIADIRICKGIYREPDRIAYQGKADIRQNYLSLVERLFQAGLEKPEIRVALATHDDALIPPLEALLQQYNVPKTATHPRYEFQVLLGVNESLQSRMQQAGHRVRVYVPYGQDWHPYCMRRFKENPKLLRYVIKNLLHI